MTVTPCPRCDEEADKASNGEIQCHFCGYTDAEGDAKILPPKGRRWRHKIRGTVYVEIGRGKIQSAIPEIDNQPCVIYRNSGGQFWVRPTAEFEDGRFEEVTP